MEEEIKENEGVAKESFVHIQIKEENKNEPVVVRLTPTGKVSHAKTRVYTQRYRKEWEHMTEFKGNHLFLEAL